MSQMNLLDMILQAKNGQVAQNAGAQLGLDANQSQQAIAALLPAISSALKMNTSKPDGLGALLGTLQKGHHDRYLDDPDIYARPDEVRQDGNAILGHLFGSKDVSRAVAGRAAQQTGIGDDILKKLLPMVATMAMGSLSKQTREPSMAEQIAGLALGGGNTRQSSGGGGLLGGLLGAALGGGQARTQQKAHQQGMGLLGRMLDADGDGSSMDDILGMAMKQMMKR